MEEVSLAGFWLALGVSALATLLYWMAIPRLALGRQFAFAGPGPVESAASFHDNPPASGQPQAIRTPLAVLASRAVLLLLAVSLGARWFAAGHAPLTNLWEFTVAFAAAAALFQVVFERLPGRSGTGLLLAPAILALLAVAAAFPSRIEPLSPALSNGDILVAHVGVMVLAYGVLTVSFAAALLQLLQGSKHRVARLPAPRTLDEIAHSSVVVGFPVLALGIALGAYWASTAWGRYWSWDPKETSALVTWLAYGAYFHLHGLRGWAGTRSSVVLIAAYGSVLFSYFAVNLWVAGLHSYAGL